MPVRTWGNTDGEWHLPGLWLENDVPDSFDDVLILSNNVTSTSSATANSLSLLEDATLTTDSDLTISAHFLIGGGMFGPAVYTMTGGTTSIGTVLAIGADPSDFGTSGIVNVNGGFLTAPNISVGGAGIGILNITNGGTVTATNPIIVGDGAANGFINIGGDGAAAVSGTLNANIEFYQAGSMLTFHTINDTLYSGVVSGDGQIRQNSPGAVAVLTGNNTNTGTTTITAGTLQLGVGGTSGALGSGAIVNNGTLHFNQNDLYNINNSHSGSGNVTFSGGGTFIMNSAFGVSGTTTINTGTAFIINNSGIGSGNITNNGFLNFATSATYGGVISGTGSVNATGGTAVLTGNNTHSGNTQITAGSTLQVGNGGTTGALGSGAVANSGTLVFNHADTLVFNTISGSGNVVIAGGSAGLRVANSYSGGTIIASGAQLHVYANSVGSGDIANSGQIWFRDSQTINSVISGSGSFIVLGTVLTLTGSNTFSGTAQIASGNTLQIGNGGTTGSLGTGAVTNDGTLHFNRSDNETIANLISGGGNVIVSGGGATTFTANNSYTGTTTINSGAIVNVGNVGTTGSLGTGAVINNGGLYFNRSGADFTVSNVFSGSGGLAFIGGATAIITGTSALTSGVVIVGGSTVALVGAGTLGSLYVEVGQGASAGTFDISGISAPSLTLLNLYVDSRGQVVLGGKTITTTHSNVSSGSGKIVGSSGTDAVVFSATVFSVDNNFTNWTDGIDSITVNGNSGFNTLTGASANATTIEGFGGDDALIGGSANDRLYGGADNDTLRGGAGADIIDGGNGTDTADYTGSIGGVTINLLTNSASGGDAAGDTLSSIENVTGGSGADVLTGNTLANVLNGGGGADQLFGGDGDDRLVFDALDTVVDGGNGTDTAVFGGTGTFTAGFVGIERLELGSGANLSISSALIGAGFPANTQLLGSGTLTINMAAPGTLSVTGIAVQAGHSAAVTINGSSGIDLVKGSVSAVNTLNGNDGNDQLRGGTQADVINGGIGNDKILGLTGADVLTGGTGNDQFRYILASDSGIGAAADQITDFVIGSDRLNLFALDADPVAAGDQAFNFIGTGAFANTGIGQVRYQNSGADLLVQVDVDGNGTVDMEMVLQGLTGQTMTSADFLL